MAAQQAAPAGGLDWSAPPFKAIPNEYGSMLPDVELYGLRVPGVGLVAVAALGMFFGWRGLLGGLIFGEGYTWKRHTHRAHIICLYIHCIAGSMCIDAGAALQQVQLRRLQLHLHSQWGAWSCQRGILPTLEIDATLFVVLPAVAAAACAYSAAGYLYLTYGQAAVAAAGHGRPASGTGAGAAAGGDGFMQQAFGGMMGGGGAEADGPGHAAAGAAARPAGAWMGKGRKLGSN